MKKPNILFLDIETAPLEAFVWGLWDNDVPLNHIRKDWFILSWAAKWYDEKQVMQQDQRRAKVLEDETLILKALSKLINQADIIVTQNGIKFDIRKINARLIKLGLPPLYPVRHIDTAKIAKKHFGFTSNKLEYLAEYLGVKYKKQKHKKFPGFELWKACLNGNSEAWDVMARYNCYDVLALQGVYDKLMPWDDSVNFNVYSPDQSFLCSCGSQHLQKNGTRATSSGIYVRYRCTGCGKTYRSPTNLISMKDRKRLIRSK